MAHAHFPKTQATMTTASLETPAASATDDALFFTDADLAVREQGDFVVYQMGSKTFRLDKAKARARLAGKRVINGMRSAELNILPLKYHEAYRIYKQMKANHWEPDVIDMTRDSQQWNTGALSAKERWIIEMGVGYFSAAEGIVGDSVLHVIEDNLTAAELKHASLRHIAEESIHMDSLLHIIGSLNIDLDEVTAKFTDIPSVRKKNAYITRQMPELKMGIDLTVTANKQKFAKAIFGITQVMEGTQFYALFAMILSLHRQNKMTGIGQMFQYTLRDESNHIELGRYILSQLIAENPRPVDAGVPRGAGGVHARGRGAGEGIRARLPAGRRRGHDAGGLPHLRGIQRRSSSRGARSADAFDGEDKSVSVARRGDFPAQGEELLRDARDGISD